MKGFNTEADILYKHAKAKTYQGSKILYTSITVTRIQDNFDFPEKSYWH